MQSQAAPRQTSAIADVHRDFHAEPEINGLGFFPSHGLAPF
jgi:hypothetical protein